VGIQLKAMTLAKYGVDYGLLVDPLAPDAAGAHRANGKYPCPSIAYVIEHPEGRVLWETGISSSIFQDWPEEWQGLVDLSAVDTDDVLEGRLKSIGLGPEDFDYVVLGHLHCDHAGGLRLFEHTSAEIIVHEKELEHVRSLTEDGHFYLKVDWEFLSRKKPTTVSDNDEILSDFRVHHLPGHTPGLMGASLRLNHTGWVVLASDAIYTHDSYGPPAAGSPIVWNEEAWESSVARLRKIAHDQDALLIPGHDEVGVQHRHGESCELREIERFPGCTYE
jgi:N-acyl homoserine lactone hydrolase